MDMTKIKSFNVPDFKSTFVATVSYGDDTKAPHDRYAVCIKDPNKKRTLLLMGKIMGGIPFWNISVLQPFGRGTFTKGKLSQLLAIGFNKRTAGRYLTITI